MSEQLPDLDLPQHAGQIPSTSAHQCPKCGGIAYNAVCPYCADDQREEVRSAQDTNPYRLHYDCTLASSQERLEIPPHDGGFPIGTRIIVYVPAPSDQHDEERRD